MSATVGAGFLPWLYDEELSKIILGDQLSMGKAVLSGHDRKPAWDNQAAKGSTGASTTLNDPNPIVVFTVTFFLFSQDDFDRWDDFQKLIESTTSGVKPFALPIYHPDLARQRITEVTNAGISGLTYDGQGGASVVVTFQEYRPAKAKPAQKPGAKASSGAAGKPAKPDPNAKAKAELAALVNEAAIA